jgi:hypothetical protein
MKFAMFISIILSLLFGMHFAFFRSIICFFNISNPYFRFFINTMMVLLTFSFVSAFLWLHLHGNGWTVWFYRFSGVWMGFLIHFLVAVTAIWVIIGIAGFTGLPLNRPFIAAVILLSAAGYSVFGTWSSFHPMVRQINVPIKHLPENWEKKTIIQLSDVHLGHIYGKSFADRLVNQVNSLNPDLILITGDLFDGVDGPYESFIESINRFDSKHGVFFVTGNHEHYAGIKEVLNMLKKTRLRVLDNEMVEVDGLQIIGVSYPGISRIEDIRNLNPAEGEESLRILMFHTPTNLLKNSGSRAERHVSAYWRPDTSFALNKKLHVDLQLSGHTHHGQIFPFNFVTQWLFRGYDYGLRRDKDFQIYTTCGTGSWGPPMRSPIRPEIALIRLDPEK